MDSIGEAGLDRWRLGGGVLDNAHGDWEESWWGGQSRSPVCEIDEPETAFPSAE